METNRKFVMTDETVEHNGVTLHRIKALRPFGRVKEGQLGGGIEKEENLSHEGDCWVYGDAVVFSNARVSGNVRVVLCAHVHGNAIVRGNALVSGSCDVSGDAVVEENAYIEDNPLVAGRATVRGNAVVGGYARVLEGVLESGTTGELIMLSDEHIELLENKRIGV